jgi:Xaa-Pro aminopeptidase
MVLIDVGAHLYGYSSDVCRSFFPPFTSTDNLTWDSSIEHKISVWHTVFEAQTQSLSALTLGHAAADVDIAARRVIEDAGYGNAFTHRVGHGIGIKAHESPYLNKGNVDTPLRAGMTFTSEPGVYLVDHFGVRHEDVLLVKEQGLPDVLSGERATCPWKP